LPLGGLGGRRPKKLKGKPRRAWRRGIKAWRMRTKELLCIYETEHLNTVDKWADVEDNTMHNKFQRTFRIPFHLYHDIVEAAYNPGRFRDNMPGRKNKIRRAPPTPLTLQIFAFFRVTTLGYPMDGLRLESCTS
jgi:hypothetical protein